MPDETTDLAVNAERAPLAGVLRQCPVCSAEFPAGRTDKRFCSGACRAKANRDFAAARVRKLEALIDELSWVAGWGK